MSAPAKPSIIGPDLVVKGDIRNGGSIEVRGYVEGSIATDHLVVHNGGRVFGTVRANAVDVNGTMQGTVAVKNLINIGPSGEVSGDVRYGRLALATGGSLEADVRNVPPELAGDFELTVRRGRSVRITPADLTAVDPDNTSAELTYAISNATSGAIVLGSAPSAAVTSFTDADIREGAVFFAHDGSSGANASFDVQVADKSGATSGAARTVTVRVV